jgi:Holliday junction DNA helicase RuvA
MISRISGVLLSRRPNQYVIDVGGLGYEVLVPTAVDRMLIDKQPGDALELHTMYYLQLDPTKAVPVLIGFVDELQKEFFGQLLTVPRLGPKIALTVFSVPMSEVAQAIEQGNATFLKQLPGVGTQKAKDLIATLQGKVAKYALMKDRPPASAGAAADATEVMGDALQMLIELKHTRAEAERMLMDAMREAGQPQTADELLRIVYRRQNR